MGRMEQTTLPRVGCRVRLPLFSAPNHAPAARATTLRALYTSHHCCRRKWRRDQTRCAKACRPVVSESRRLRADSRHTKVDLGSEALSISDIRLSGRKALTKPGLLTRQVVAVNR